MKYLRYLNYSTGSACFIAGIINLFTGSVSWFFILMFLSGLNFFVALKND